MMASGCLVPVPMIRQKVPVTFFAYGVQDNKPLAGAVVNVDGVTATTGADGKVAVELRGGKTYDYTVDFPKHEQYVGAYTVE